ncbi:RNA endoribonuclease [Podila humilis]|nr:RNA endoribonuclease [Podila humilis]
MMTELQLQLQHQQERETLVQDQSKEREQILAQQQARLQEQQSSFLQCQVEFQQEPSATKEHTLLMAQQSLQHLQEMFHQQQNHVLDRHQHDQLRLQERQWHQEQLLIQQIQQQHRQGLGNQQYFGLQGQQPYHSPHYTTHTQQRHIQHPPSNQQPQLPPQQQLQLPSQLTQELYNDDTEAMDIDDEATLLSITSMISTFRKGPSRPDSSSLSSWDLDSSSATSSAAINDKNEGFEAIVVLDTNVLLSHLNFLRQLVEVSDAKYTEPSSRMIVVFVVPWVVIQELDRLKVDRGRRSEVDVSLKARQAIKFIQDELERPATKRSLRGQKVSECLEKRQTNDDYILDCCQYFQKLMSDRKRTKVTLFSNDRNLCVKALIHEIATISHGKVEFTVDAVIKVVSGSDQKNSDHINDTATPAGTMASAATATSTAIIATTTTTTATTNNTTKNNAINMTGGSGPSVDSSTMEMDEPLCIVRVNSTGCGKGTHITASNQRELQRIKATSKVIAAPPGMDSHLFELATHIIIRVRRCLDRAVPDHLEAYYGAEWKRRTRYDDKRTKPEDMQWECRRLAPSIQLLQTFWHPVFADQYHSTAQGSEAKLHLDSVQTFIKTWDRVETFGLGKVYKKDLVSFLDDIEAVLTGILSKPKSYPENLTPEEMAERERMYDPATRLKLIKEWKTHCNFLQS